MRKQSTIAVLMFASIAAMMVANPGMPAKKHKKTQADSTAVAVGDSVNADSLGKKGRNYYDAEIKAPSGTQSSNGESNGGSFLAAAGCHFRCSVLRHRKMAPDRH